MARNDTIVIRITGDSGDGVQLLGEQLTITAALNGRDVRSEPDFPAEIRSPAGTVAGVSGFQLAMAEKAIFTAGETLDVLVSLNPAALKKSLEFLVPGGLLLVNEDSFQEKDWLKAGLSSDLLKEAAANCQVLGIPLIRQTLEAVKSLDLTHAQAKKSKNFYVLGVVLWLFNLPLDSCIVFIKKKFKTHPEIAKANELTLAAGYNYAETLELGRQKFILDALDRKPGNYRQITGVEAVSLALATLALGTRTPLLVSGYPITPSSSILHECARLKDYGLQLFQAEDEIAAICASLGAAFGGCLAFTCTSGPGFDLKTEGLGLAIMCELPLVIVDVQRAGASTGLPTKTGQSDLRQALFGRHGEAPVPVYAANSPADCFMTIIEAFTTAIEYMTPVIVLLDAYLATAAEPWKIPAFEAIKLPQVQYNRSRHPFHRNEKLARSWNRPGDEGFIHQIGGLEKQGEEGRVSYEAENHQNMVNIRAAKIKNIAKDYAPLQVEGPEEAEILLVGWGSTYGCIRTAVAECNLEGIPVAFVHLRQLNPLPNDLGSILARYKKVLVAELNTGQLCQLIRAEYLVNAQSISQCNGQNFSRSTLIQAIKAEFNYENSLYA